MSDTPPSLLRLVEEGLVREPTRRILLDRLKSTETHDPIFFPEAEWQTLIALAERLRPRTPQPSALELALAIDSRLAKGETDGWRYDDLPPDGEANRRGLMSLDRESRTVHGKPFAELDGELADGLIRRLQKGETETNWDVDPVRFLEELLVELVTFAYAHPSAQDSIGYVGYADAKGWSHIGLDQREDWER